MTTRRIALAQMTSGIDPAANAAALVDAVAEAAGGGAAMMFTPEMTGLVDRDRGRAARAIVAEADDPVLAAACGAAKTHGIWLHLGSLAVRGSDDRFANRGFVIDANGRIRARYDKLHLFDVDVSDNRGRYRESDDYRHGQQVVVADTPVGRLGLSVCYDLRFAELYTRLREAGAELISAPSAFTAVTGAAHWEVLVRARAIETQCYLLAAAQGGMHPGPRETYGHSLLVDAWGRILAEQASGEGVLFAQRDAEEQASIRQRMPVVGHRRFSVSTAPRPITLE